MTVSNAYLDHLNEVVQKDVESLHVSEKSYGDSWKRRGGVGAYMMLARKIDRIENHVKKLGYDVFAAISSDMRPEGIIDDIRDLRRYLALVEAEMMAQGVLIQEVKKDVEEPEFGKGALERMFDGGAVESKAAQLQRLAGGAVETAPKAWATAPLPPGPAPGKPPVEERQNRRKK